MKLVWGLTRTLIHILLGLLLIALAFPLMTNVRRQRLIRWWSQRVLAICGVSLRLPDAAGTDALSAQASLRNSMLLLNHISWLDIYVVHALKPARFVAKSEIRAWPVIGYLCDRTGTIFIERGKRHAVHQANQIVTDALRAGDCVGVFPEGTTTEGDRLLPFHANLIQAAIEAGAVVRPAALRYFQHDAAGREIPTRAAAYVGDMSLFDSLKLLLQQGPVIAELSLLDAIKPNGKTRHEIANAARAAIAAHLGIDLHANSATSGFSPVSDTLGRPLETMLDLPDELL